MYTILVPLTETQKMVAVVASLIEYQIEFTTTMSGGNWEIELKK